MRYIVRKFIDAETVHEAIAKELTTPIHDVYLKEGEEPNRKTELCSAVGFAYTHPSSDDIAARKKS